jgi:hypothetical protein
MKVHNALRLREGRNVSNVSEINGLSLWVDVLHEIDLLIDSSQLVEREYDREKRDES